MVRKGKTDQKREGRKIGIPYGKDPLTCPARALCEWIAEAQITSGPLFRAVTKFGRVRPTRLSDRVVAEIVKKYCASIGKQVPLFSGHSLRAGFATSAAIAGASERSIQKQTGHASVNILRRYIREAEMFRDNALSKAGFIAAQPLCSGLPPSSKHQSVRRCLTTLAVLAHSCVAPTPKDAAGNPVS